MMTAEKYREKHEALMKEWAKEVREWTETDGIFYVDGVFDPDTWFNENKFKPLFILKEVNEQDPEAAKAELEKQDEEFKNKKFINFVGIDEKGNDPWKGKGMWGRIGILARAMFEMKIKENSIYHADYDQVRGEMNEAGHQSTCRQIAIINLKKLAGGSNTASEKSKSTLCFECHAKYFYNKLMEQIRLIQPTVIICCGKDSVIGCLRAAKEDVSITIDWDGESHNIPLINGYHPQQTSNENFFYKTLEQMNERGIL